MSEAQHHPQSKNVDVIATLEWICESTDAKSYLTGVARQQQWLRDALNVQRKFFPFNNRLELLNIFCYPQPMQSSGYTPLSAFGKPIAGQNSAIEDKLNLKTPIVATTDQEGISGKFPVRLLSLSKLIFPLVFSQDT